MNRQRGLAMIAIYAIVAGAIALGLVGWWEYHNYQIRADEKKKWQAEVTGLKANVETAIAANQSCQESIDRLRKTVATQTAAIDALKAQEAAARAARQEALARALAKERGLREEVARLTIIAQAPPIAPASAQQELEVCHEARDILRAAAPGRVQ